MEIHGINHITYSVSNLNRSIEFYRNVFDAEILVKGDRLAYFDLNGLWLALNEEKDIPRNEIYKSYTHLSFSIKEDDYNNILSTLQELEVEIQEGRPRYEEEGKSIYFRDPDGHLLEFHTGKREARIEFYKNKRKDLEFFY